MKLFNQLVKKVEDCCDDGISCDRCPVAADCRRFWDSVCWYEMVDRREYSRYAARLTMFRNKKRLAHSTGVVVQTTTKMGETDDG